MTRLRATVLVASLGLVSGVTMMAAMPAHAATVCEQYGSTTSGNYVIMNNRWGTSATQCIETSGSGFTITQNDGVGNFSGAPTAYPAVYLGCHYGNCSPGSPLPKQISSIGSANSSVSFNYASGVYDAAYDIWLDSTAKTTGVNQTEIMIWFNHTGSIQPIGSPVGSANVNGQNWTVWTGSNGQNDVVSYVAPSAISSLSFDVMNFVRDTISRGKATTSWYLTSVQAGFEPWQGGVGLSVSNFSASIGGGGSERGTETSTETSSESGNMSGTETSSGDGPCSASYSTVSSWSGGFQGSVRVSGSGLSGWKVQLGLPGGATINSLWNGQASGSSGTVTVTNTSHNGSGGDFGFVASGNPGNVTASCSAN
jgi:hypothetical protein